MVPLSSYFKVSLKKELEKFPKLKTKDIVEIQQWMTTQHDLPPSPDILIAHFLLASNCDMEVAKKAIKLNFEYKRSMPEFLDEWDPLLEAVQVQAKHVLYFAFLPRTSPSQPRMCFARLRENSVARFDLALNIKWSLLSYQSILFTEGQQEFNLIIDATNFSFSHALKMSYGILKKHEDYTANAAPVRVTKIHFINSHSIVRKLVGLAKMFNSKQRFNMVEFHGAAKEYFDNLPPDSVPADYGGSGPSVEYLHEENTKRVLRNRKALMAFCDFK